MRNTFRKRYKSTKHKKEYFVAILWRISFLRNVLKINDEFKRAFESLGKE